MKETNWHSETCKLIQESTGKTVDAVVQSFQENQSISVIVNKSVKLSLKWNGKIYEGRMAGIDFTTIGPTVHKSQKVFRG